MSSEREGINSSFSVESIRSYEKAKTIIGVKMQIYDPLESLSISTDEDRNANGVCECALLCFV